MLHTAAGSHHHTLAQDVHGMQRMRVLFLVAGLGALWVGLSFYLCARSRPPALVASLGQAATGVHATWLGGSLPSLLHAFAFTALGAACARRPGHAVRCHALGWTAANAAWELLGNAATQRLGLHTHGAFIGFGDGNDILFAALGAALATCLIINPNKPLRP